MGRKIIGLTFIMKQGSEIAKERNIYMLSQNAPTKALTYRKISSIQSKNILFLMILIVMGIFLFVQILFFFSLSKSLSNQVILKLNFLYDVLAAVSICFVMIKMSELRSKNLKTELVLADNMRAEMQQIKNEWEKTFDSMFDWVSIISTDHTIIRSNRCCKEISGIDVEDIIGKKCCKIIHGTDGPIPGCPFNEMIENRRRASAEVISIDGLWVIISIDPIFDEHGDIISAVHIVRDISARKSYEIEREKLIEKLDQADHKIKVLSGLVPICSFCKKIRDESGRWERLENFIQERSEATFSHSLCPDCFQKNYPDFYSKKTEN